MAQGAPDMRDAGNASGAPRRSLVRSAMALLLLVGCGTAPPRDTRPPTQDGTLEIDYPPDGAVFPPEFPPPTFKWRDATGSTSWRVAIELKGDGEGVVSEVRTPEWTPTEDEWRLVKARSVGHDARLVVTGIGGPASVTFATSADPVGAPLFYREVNLPFAEAVKDPSRIRWRFGPVSSREAPPVVLEGMLVCGNCHSFSDDGATLGMDVDYANDKGSYAVLPVAKEMSLAKENIITWSDYRPGDGEPTFGLLSQVSPDGRRVVSTVKDQSVFVPRPDLAFSQLFFPVKGILAVYDLGSRTVSPLPGADDAAYVQSNPEWSPDGEHVVFARSRAHPLKTRPDRTTVLLSEEECREFLDEGKKFLFDLYRVPFRGGAGGKPEPLEGASRNGMSNYFAKHSPDGKWIVFCRARSFMLLQPDSELYIMPAGGGTARRMRCNAGTMNSWHSFSPNGRWLAFSSKRNGPYTQVWLAHIDEEGRSSPPVVLSRFTAPDRAANIPEFVNAPPDAIARITERFVDSVSYLRAGREFMRAGDMDGAIAKYRRSLELDAANAETHYEMGFALIHKGEPGAAARAMKEALRIEPEHANALFNLGVLEARSGDAGRAERLLNEALRVAPDHAKANHTLGLLRLRAGRADEAAELFAKAIELDPGIADARNNLGLILLRRGKPAEAERHIAEAARLDPADGYYRHNLGLAASAQGREDDAVAHFLKAVELEKDLAGPHNALGDIFLRRGKLLESARHSIEAARLERRSAGPWARAIECAKRARALGKTRVAEEIEAMLGQAKAGKRR